MNARLVLLLSLLPALGCGDVASGAAEREARLLDELCSSHHPVPPAVLAALDDDDARVLRGVARDDSRPLWVRARAASLAGSRPSAASDAMWRELSLDEERELRVQAAWARGVAHLGEGRARYAADLLRADDSALREVGAHLLATTRGEPAIAIARAAAARETDEAVRAVLERKILSRARRGGG